MNMMKTGRNAALSGLAALSFSNCAQQLTGTFETGRNVTTVGPNGKKSEEFIASQSASARIRGGNILNTEAGLAFAQTNPRMGPDCNDKCSKACGSAIVASGSLNKESGSRTLANLGQAAQGAAAVGLAVKWKPDNINVKATGGKGGQGGSSTSTSNSDSTSTSTSHSSASSTSNADATSNSGQAIEVPCYKGPGSN